MLIDRGDYWQCGLVIAKGGYDVTRAAGLPAFQAKVARLAPFLADRVGEIRDWEQVKLLTVQVDRLKQWHRPGLLCIGDAAHAMSPVGGVGINLAVQDAVAAATLLADPLLRGAVTSADLAAVRTRRLLPTIVIQALQRLLHRGLVKPILDGQRMGPPRPVLAILRRVPQASYATAYLVGVGPRPEHAPAFARRAARDASPNV